MCLHIKLHKFSSRTKILEFTEKYNLGRPLGERLRQQHVHLIEHLLELYYLTIQKRRYHGEDVQLGDMLPSFRTNNVQLAKRMNCAERTVRNLRQRLKAAGIIEAETFHGSNSSYEIWLNPDILHLSTKATQNDNAADYFQRPNGQPPRLSLQSLPHTVTSKNLLDTKLLNKLSGALDPPSADSQSVTATPTVENHENPVEKPGEPVDKPQLVADRVPETGYRTSIRKNEDTSPPVAAAPPAIAPTTLDEVLAGLPTREANMLRRVVERMYGTAVNVLYGEWWIAAAERERTLAALAEYLRYAPLANWKNGATEVMERMALVRRWMDKNYPDGAYKLPLPSRYFDVRNPSKAAFVRTKQWFKDHKAAQREIHNRVQLTKAVKEYFRSLEPNAPRSPAETYRRIAQRLNKRDRQLLELFHQQIEQHETATA
ncbi:MAG: hypothetical protein AAF840_06610 [Bacteroidota bacterium]